LLHPYQTNLNLNRPNKPLLNTTTILIKHKKIEKQERRNNMRKCNLRKKLEQSLKNKKKKDIKKQKKVPKSKRRKS
jgi:hypothetical protein